MEIRKLKEDLARDLLCLGYTLYDVSYNRNEKILQVVIDKQMDLNEISDLSEKVSGIMDLYDEDMEEYLLDVCSVGIERPIRDKEEMKRAVGSYIFLKVKKEGIYGDLIAMEEDTLILEVMEKNIRKKKSVAYKDVVNARYAVKF